MNVEGAGQESSKVREIVPESRVCASYHCLFSFLPFLLCFFLNFHLLVFFVLHCSLARGWCHELELKLGSEIRPELEFGLHFCFFFVDVMLVPSYFQCRE